MKKNLEKYCVNSGLFSDVTFELDDGHIKSHRAMLIARCDVMRAMLNGDFREAHSNVVSTNWNNTDVDRLFYYESNPMI